MKKEKLYKKIIFILSSILITLIIHNLVTRTRGYSAIGGEFLVIPLLLIINQGVILIKERWKETNEYFERKESAVEYKEIFTNNLKEGQR